jgi:hypothetical protein
MNFEHFKTCVRAYFPGCNFYWLRDCNKQFLKPICISEADIREVAIRLDVLASPNTLPEDDETALVRYLKKFSRMPGINPDTLAFGGDMYLVQVTDDYKAIVLVIDKMEISTHAKQFPGIPDNRI